MKVTAKDLREILMYSPRSGVFYWRKRMASFTVVGGVAGGITKDGYIRIRVKGERYLAHRLAYLYMKGEWPADEVDHRNGVRDDNRWRNLRAATRAENMRNKGEYRNNKSGFRGVSWHPPLQQWVAKIQHNGKSRHLGYFDLPEDAAKAYEGARVSLNTYQPIARG